VSDDPTTTAPPARSTRSGHAALLAVQLVFGLFPVFVLLAVDGGFAPQALAAWRLVFGTVAVGAVAFLAHRRAVRVRRGLFGPLLVCSLSGVLANQVLALEGTARTSASAAGLLMTMIPVFTFAIAAVTRQERFTLRQIVGVPIAMSGAVYLLVAARGASIEGSDPALGVALILANTFCYAGYLVYSRRVLVELPPAVFLFWVYLLSLPAAPFLAWGHDLVPSATDPVAVARGWWGLALLLVGPTFLAYLLNAFALARVPASVTAIYIYMQPLIAASGGALVLGETLAPALFVAASLVFSGIALVTMGRARSGLPPEPSPTNTASQGAPPRGRVCLTLPSRCSRRHRARS